MKDFDKNDVEFGRNDTCVIVDNFVEIGDFSVFPHFLRVCF